MILARHKKFRVIYPDGAVSVPMDEDVAKDYRDMFGGTLQDVTPPNTRLHLTCFGHALIWLIVFIGLSYWLFTFAQNAVR